MAWKAWLYLCLAVITTVLVADEVAATDISIEDGKGPGLVCEGPVNIFWNVTVTNDDSPSSEYDIFIYGPQFNIEPESVLLELDYGESSVARFQGMIRKNSAHTSQAQVAVDVDSSNGGDVSEFWPVIIDQCANLTLEAEQTRVEGRPGDSLTLPFEIWNRGNGIDTLFLELEGLPAGWQAEFPANLTLESFESRQVTVNMTPDASAASIIRLITTSEIPGLNVTYAEIEVVVQTFFEEYRGRFAGGGLVIAAGVGVALYYRRRLG